MKTFKVIIFGINDYADLACWYLLNDSSYIPVAFAVHRQYREGKDTHMGLPIINWEDLEDHYKPGEVNLFCPVRDNVLRCNLFYHGKVRGYDFISYVSSKAIANGRIGENCFVQEFNNIQPFAWLGNNVVLWAGNHIGHHSRICDGVTITSHCVVSGHCVVGVCSYLGVNCTVRDGIIIQPYVTVGQGSNVVKHLDDERQTYIGNPAKRLYK